MRLEDITNVLCLSCVLMFFYVSSQPSCPNGWFGSQCKYKCRCTNDSCKVDGSCTDINICQGGWFGPACQYADLAYLTPISPVLTDADDDTCNNASSGTTSQIMLNKPIVFSWLRIRIMNQGIDDFSQLSVSFSFNNSAVSCPALKKHDVDSTTQDIHCDLPDNIDEVTVTGQSVPHVCSVYVSGGRNVALMENARQATTFALNVSDVPVNFSADKAVDGNRNQDFYQLSCTHTRNTSTWSVRFASPRSVNRYLIFNRVGDSSYRLLGFSLESFNALNASVFTFTDEDTRFRDNYTIIHPPLPIQEVTLGVNINRTLIMTLCEVEIYGDSICDAQHFGRECEHSCGCSGNVACFVSTGGCPTGCPAGFFGIGCVTKCGREGRFGEFCNLSCSENCGSGHSSNCDRSGVCHTECHIGTTGPYCEDRCNVGTFGRNCSSSCSENCQPSAEPTVSSCDASSGVCQSGCRSGFTGQSCQEVKCSPNCAPSGQEDVSSCDNKTGDCLKGCKSGFSGASCQDKCRFGEFGVNCTESCSPKCAPSGQANKSSCDTKTGVCLKGCQSGFSGASCQDGSPSAAVAETSVPMELILGLCGLVAALFVLAVCFRRKETPRQAAEGAAVNAQQE